MQWKAIRIKITICQIQIINDQGSNPIKYTNIEVLKYYQKVTPNKYINCLTINRINKAATKCDR